MLFQRDAHAKQQLAGARLGGITVVLGEFGLQLGRMHVVVLGGLKVGVNRVTLAHGGPHFGVSLQHHVEHALVFVGKLVLAQLAQTHARLDRHIAGSRLQVPPQNLHEGGFARTIGTDQAVAVAFAKLDGNIFKQRLDAELHGDIRGSDHAGNPWLTDCPVNGKWRILAQPQQAGGERDSHALQSRPSLPREAGSPPA